MVPAASCFDWCDRPGHARWPCCARVRASTYLLRAISRLELRLPAAARTWGTPSLVPLRNPLQRTEKHQNLVPLLLTESIELADCPGRFTGMALNCSLQ